MAASRAARQHARVGAVLGTMTFAGQTKRDSAAEMLRMIAGRRYEIDTARLYEDGRTEELIGDLLARSTCRPVIATKIHPWDGQDLSPHSVREQLDASIAALGLSAVDILYLHGPDPTTPIETTLAVLQEHHAQGRFHELGLSNFSVEDVGYIHGFMMKRGWIVPTVYQGIYNYASRGVEKELLTRLRELRLRFYAFNPLAGGLLTGKYVSTELASGGRFVERPHYQSWYWHPEFFDALNRVRPACAGAEVSMTDAALRWLVHHSSLCGNRGDAIILGASKVDHLASNLAACEDGPLDHSVVEAIESAWAYTEAKSRLYHKGPCLRSE